MTLADKSPAILWAKPCPLQLNDDCARPFWSSSFVAPASYPRAPSSLPLCSSCIMLLPKWVQCFGLESQPLYSSPAWCALPSVHLPNSSPLFQGFFTKPLSTSRKVTLISP